MPQASISIRFLVAVLCLGGLGVACSKPVHTSVDAGAPPDAGMMMVVDAGPQAIGGGCKQDSDCVSGHCDTQVPGGYCLDTCTDNTSCPDGAVCEQVGQGRAYCVSICTKPTDCRSGDTCVSGADICVPGTTGCQQDSDCVTSMSCDTATGLCTDAIPNNSAIGTECAQDSDCSAGRRPFCITADNGFTGGYCSSLCRSDRSCGSTGTCVPNMIDIGNGQTAGACMEKCSSNSDCRAQYNCIDSQGQQFCYPFCRTDSDCINSGATCDPVSGLCSGGVPPGQNDGGMDGGVDGGMDTDGGMDMTDGGTDLTDGGMDVTDGGSPVDAGPSMIPGWTGGYPAGPRPAAPQVISGRGPVLKEPTIVPVFFSNDDPATVSQLADFDSRVGATNYWKAATAEYGVGPAVALPPVMLSDIATGTIDDSNIQTWLQDKITAKELPAPDGDYLYVLHYPQWMTITLQGSQSCQFFGGYHSDVILDDGTDVAYAVLPRCQPQMGEGSVLDIETGSESHEMIEAATDPYPMTNAAFAQVDDAHVYWDLILGGSEVGDMCAQNPDAFVKFDELPYMVQRTWSNKAAKAGLDPCQPELPGKVFFAAVPELNDTVTVNLFGQTARVSAVDVSSGPKTIPIDLYSEAATTGPWSVSVQDFGAGSVSFSLDRSTGQNGDRLYLTVTPTKSNPGNLENFIIDVKLGSDDHFWIGAAGQ